MCFFLQHNLGIKTLNSYFLCFFFEVMNSHVIFNDLYLWVKLNAYVEGDSYSCLSKLCHFVVKYEEVHEPDEEVKKTGTFHL